MKPEFQTAIALGLVAVSVLYFVARWWNRRTKPGCHGDCGCAARKKL